MATYEVERREWGGTVVRRVVNAQEPVEAMWELQLLAPPAREDHVYTVYRRRRLRGRQAVLAVAGHPGGEDGGTAGVREPRRPLPDPGHLTAERNEPAGTDRD